MLAAESSNLWYRRHMDPSAITPNRLFSDLAYLWPVMSPPQEYAEEAQCWRTLLRERFSPGRPRVLELGVGGGHNLSHLTNDVEATAVDISAEMLRHSVALNPGVEHIVGDMRRVRLGRNFQAVLIHDAISCMTTPRDLAAVFATAAAHLKSGGLLLTSPDYFAESLALPRTECHTYTRGDIELTYVEYTYDPDPSDTMIDIVFTFFIRSAGSLQIEHDRLQAGVFPRSTWRKLMYSAGFEYSERTFHLQHWEYPYTILVGVFR